MQTQEDHLNPIQALNVDSLKVDLVVIQNTCSEKEDSNSESASSKLFTLDYDNQMTDQYFVEYTGIEMQTHESKIDTSKAIDDDLVVTESSGTESEVQDNSSRSWNDTYADDADIRPIYDEEQMAEVQLTVECNIFAIGQQHTKQPEIINEGRVDHSKAKIKKEIDVLETMNIQLEHSVAKLRKENETLKKHYKDLYDSIKITRSKTIEQTTSLLANNTDLKAQIQEKVFAIAALKNNLRKLKGNSIDTKFTKTSVLGKPILQSLRNQSVVRQPNAFKSERPQMSKQRNSSKNMPRFSSNDMVHNHYLDEARKKTQERDRNSKASVMPSARFQSTADGSKIKPRSTNHSTRSLPVSKSSCVTIAAVPIADYSKNYNSFSDSKHVFCSTCHKCVFNTNHDACITKLQKEVHSCAKTQSYKTRNYNKPVDQKSHTQKPGRQIFIGHRFSPNKTSVVYEKTSPRYDLRWKPTGRIFKTVGLRWVPTGKILASCARKDDSEPTYGSNVDIPNIHESKQTLDLSAELESLFGYLFDEYLNEENLVVSKSSVVPSADASDKRQQQPDSTSSTSTLATSVTADGNFDM
ncbi:hypothetical protein Tco_0920194 [Tanacetum coccineum]